MPKRKATEPNENDPSSLSNEQRPRKTRKNALGDATSHITNERPPDTKAARESRINDALSAIHSGSARSVDAAALTFSAPASTLKYRLKGGRSRTEGHIKQQILSESQKEVLIEWCKVKGHRAETWSRLELRQKVFEITGRKPCEKWVKRFLNKNPSVSPYNTRPLDPKRARAFNSRTVNGFFDLLEKDIIDYEIPMENIYNTDEKGLQLGGGRRSSLIQRIYETGSKDRYILKGDSLTLITIIEAVCADGTLCPPGIIMPPGATGDWMSVEGLGCFTQSANGWTDNYICHQWFEKCFIPFATTRNTSGKPILLISDGHQSHETPEMRLLAFENLVILLSLPPKTTHKLQPLDNKIV
ncbi:hypothetical protein M422DRAFT_263115 [Sphaerobolus stellatus SS14]|uniref:DDE-1 domain-containing protein n=1 Tax=Sphaerobolus stellatus (strain SS14) TaxID=990650 RepID=A0A0C9UZM5_SPHS4|nr:hypothetical protein M422DRAFT_263115 [Sphaerobolus stellatus SS14]